MNIWKQNLILRSLNSTGDWQLERQKRDVPVKTIVSLTVLNVKEKIKPRKVPWTAFD